MIKILHLKVPWYDFAKYWGDTFISQEQMLWNSIWLKWASRLKNVLKLEIRNYIGNYFNVKETKIFTFA